ncbi:hypothetical protein GEV33_004202 [Tenebrio molitor]|uniref:Uncharacterized protein n=1 Tax=Tenebrio molitor TaxID=7067 RepID=A0A8J6LDK7_TENMO|nr:hypothetical protein GEV33_004202 [Tenebrio molitor]
MEKLTCQVLPEKYFGVLFGKWNKTLRVGDLQRDWQLSSLSCWHDSFDVGAIPSPGRTRTIRVFLIKDEPQGATSDLDDSNEHERLNFSGEPSPIGDYFDGALTKETLRDCCAGMRVQKQTNKLECKYLVQDADAKEVSKDEPELERQKNTVKTIE